MSNRWTRFFFVFFAVSSLAMAGRTSRITITAGGVEANDDSRYIAAVSADGRYVAFCSKASNLVTTDNNGYHDIFLKDMNDGSTTLISKNLPGTDSGNGASYWPVISDDGGAIAFYSMASNLVAGDSNSNWDVFVWRRSSGTIELVSKSSGGVQGNGCIDSLDISGDGNVVAFSSNADNLVAGDSNGTWDVFVHYSGTTRRVSVSSVGVQGDAGSFSPSLSYDGMIIAFESRATNLAAGDTNGRCDVFTHNMNTDMTERVSVTSSFGQVYLGDSTTPSISRNGRYVAFISRAWDLGNGAPKRANIYLRDRTLATTTQITNGNADSAEPAVSYDGSYVSFISEASNLVAGDTNAAVDVFRYKRSDASTVRVSLADDDSQSQDRSYARCISRGNTNNGQFVVFHSYSQNLVAGDTNGTGDLFLRDIDGTGAGTAGTPSSVTPATVATGTTVRAGIGNGEEQANAASYEDVFVSTNGNIVVFASSADNLVAGDTNGMMDVFVRDLSAGTTIRISEFGGTQGNGHSYSPVATPDGSVIAFISQASNFGTDTNNQPDVFLYKSGNLSRVSDSFAGAQQNGPVDSIAISADGEIVAYSSLANNLVAGDTNATWDVFVCTVLSGMVTRVSTDAVGTQGNGPSFNPSINSNGTITAFDSYAFNLIAGDTNGRGDVFVADRSGAPAVEKISLPQIGSQPLAGNSFNPALSSDGAYVAFTTLAWDLFGNDFNASSDIVLHRRSDNAIIRLKGATEPNGWSFNPSISSDGRYISFTSDSSNLITGDTNGSRDVFRFDRTDSSLIRVSVTKDGEQANGLSSAAAVGSDGAFVAFVSVATNLVPGDTNGVADVFVRDIAGTYAPEIRIVGDGNEIASGDTTPSTTDDTDFGNVSRTQTPVSHTFTVENTGIGYLNLTGTPTVAISGTHASDFTVTAQPSTTLLSSAQASTFTIQFQPSGTGLRSATVTITNTDADEGTYTFSIQGTGTAPQIVLKYGAVAIANGDSTPSTTEGTDLGTVTIGNTPSSSTFTIENTGDYQLVLTGTTTVAIGGTNPGDFSVVAQPATTVAASGSVNFTIAFDPQAAGTRTAIVTIENDDPVTGNFSFGLQGIGNRPPVAAASATSTNVRAWDTVTLTAAVSSDPDLSTTLTYSWNYDSGPMSPGPTLTDVTPDSQVVSFVPQLAGTYQFTVTVSDGYASDTETVTVVVTTRQRLVTGTVQAATDSWLTVQVPYDYVSMVVVCTPEYDYNVSRPILVPRIRNASGTSFDVRLYGGNASTPSISGIPVRYVVVETGVYNATDHGVDMEAATFTSNVVSRKNGWVADTSYTYQNSYSSTPAVLGQVMTTNDEDYQVFWARGGSTDAPPSTSTLYVGRHIGEDPDTTRASETVGFIVFKAGAQSSDSVNFYAALTSDLVQGIQNGPYTQSVGAVTPACVVLSAAGMDGGDGGYPILNGPNALGPNSFRVAMDEDTLGDTDRSHTTENVAYVAFGSLNNTVPIANAQTVETVEDTTVGVTLTASYVGGSETYAVATSPTSGTLSGTAPNLTYTPNASSIGEDSFTFTVTDGGVTSSPATVTIRVAPASPYLITGLTLANSSAWATVDLPRTFTSMVVVCTPSYDNSSRPPMVARVQNATGSSFQVRIHRADGSSGIISSIPVHYVVAEEGAYTVAGHGIKMEAHRFSTSQFAHNGNWTAVPRTYTNTYTSPIVLGQVVTTNDSQYQAFWAMDGSVGNPPDNGGLALGRHIGEDPNRIRADEELGYIVIEAGSGTVSGLGYEAGLVSDTVTNNTTTWPTGLAGAEVGALSSAGMDGNNGGFPVFVETPLLASGFRVAIDEDTLGDTERSHTTENVAYAVFESTDTVLPFAFDQQVTAFQDIPMTITLKATAMGLGGGTWTISSPSGSGSIASSGPALTYTPGAGFTGTEFFTFTATNGIGVSNTATVTITVNPLSPAPAAPVVESLWAGPDPDALASPANLEASAYDMNDDNLTYTWVKLSGPGTVSFTASSAAATLKTSFVSTLSAASPSSEIYSASFSEPGVYELRLTVSDGTTSTSRDMTVNVTSVESAGSSGGGGGCHLGLAGGTEFLIIAILAMLGLFRAVPRRK